MGAIETIAPSPKANTRTAQYRSSPHPQWHFVGVENRGALARYAEPLRFVEYYLQPLLSMAKGQYLGAQFRPASAH